MISSGDAGPRFEFASVRRVIFGAGTAAELPTVIRDLGTHAFLVTGRNPQRAGRWIDALRAAQITVTVWPTEGEPTVKSVMSGSIAAREAASNVVIGFGGGSALDAAKAIAALTTNPGHLLDYLEVIGQGKPLSAKPAPLVLVPTTAGTGTEATRNAVVASPEHRVKASLRSTHLLAQAAIVDPDLTRELPPAITASTGLDALTQLLEPFICLRANPMVDALCREGIPRIARSLVRAVEVGTDREARSNMALASLWSGMALANAGLGAVHGFAAPLGGMFPIPHGVACAALLAPVMEANLAAVRRLQSPIEHRFLEMAAMLTGQQSAAATDGPAWISDVTRKLGIPGLGQYGLTSKDLPEVAQKAMQASSMKANPVKFSESELVDILQRAL